MAFFLVKTTSPQTEDFNMRNILRRLKKTWIAFLLLAGIGALGSCSVSGGAYVVTLAKLHNLKVAMSYLTQFALGGDRQFPTTKQEIIDFMEEEAGYKSAKQSKDTPFVDGWGNEMRFDGDVNQYTICSAGPDETFDTKDDIYLTGNPDTEYIIDGVKESNASGKELMKTMARIPYQEPNGYYRIVMPGKYSVIDAPSGWRSVITFRYTENNTVVITAEPESGVWDPQREMITRIRDVKNGVDKKLWDYEVVESNLVTVDQAPGYVVYLEKAAAAVRLYGIRSNAGLEYSVVITAGGEDRQLIMDTLTEAIQTGLDLR